MKKFRNLSIAASIACLAFAPFGNLQAAECSSSYCGGSVTVSCTTTGSCSVDDDGGTCGSIEFEVICAQ